MSGLHHRVLFRFPCSTLLTMKKQRMFDRKKV